MMIFIKLCDLLRLDCKMWCGLIIQSLSDTMLCQRATHDFVRDCYWMFAANLNIWGSFPYPQPGDPVDGSYHHRTTRQLPIFFFKKLILCITKLLSKITHWNTIDSICVYIINNNKTSEPTRLKLTSFKYCC